MSLLPRLMAYRILYTNPLLLDRSDFSSYSYSFLFLLSSSQQILWGALTINIHLILSTHNTPDLSQIRIIDLRVQRIEGMLVIPYNVSVMTYFERSDQYPVVRFCVILCRGDRGRATMMFVFWFCFCFLLCLFLFLFSLCFCFCICMLTNNLCRGEATYSTNSKRSWLLEWREEG